MRYQTLNQLWQRHDSPPRGRHYKQRRVDSMSSQQLKTSVEKALHVEPALQAQTQTPTLAVPSKTPDRLSKVSLEPPPTDERRTSRSSRTKVPTGLGIEPLNIVILGASFGGLSCAHHFLDYTIEHLRKTSTSAPNYRLVIVSPSTHIYCKPRARREACQVAC